ncbi:MAG: hypothetical protein COC24_019000 [Alphaproteobacteria bacterium]|nr:hypothetical protein [Alphaproteobacteria bacterium]
MFKIKRTLSYDTLDRNHQAPTLSAVIEGGLKVKYGIPSIWKTSSQNGEKGEIYWVISPETGKSYGESFPPECAPKLDVETPWAAPRSEKARIQFYAKHGRRSSACGRYVKVAYKLSGDLVSSLITTLVDVDMIYDAIEKTYAMLKSKVDRNEADLRRKAGEVKTEF